MLTASLRMQTSASPATDDNNKVGSKGKGSTTGSGKEEDPGSDSGVSHER